MARIGGRRTRRVEITHLGEHFALGRTTEFGGIWDKHTAVRRRPGDPVQSFPLTDDGWHAAWEQFAAWEPNAEPFTAAVALPSSRRARLIRLAAVAAVVVVGGGSAYAATMAAHSGQPYHNATPRSSGPTSTTASSSVGSSATVPNVSPVGGGYLASGDGYVDFIQWTNDHGQLSGRAQAIGVSGQPPSMQTTNETLTISGSLHGSTLSLSFNGGAATFGTLSGNGFTLNFPQSDGTLAPISFHYAAATDFDAQVVAIGRNVVAANASEANAEAIQQQQRKIDADVTTVNRDIDSIASAAASMTTDAQNVAGGSLAGQPTDLATTRTDEQTVISEATTGGDPNQVCVDANGVGVDANGVAVDANGVEVDANTVVQDLNTERGNFIGITNDFAQLQSDEAQLPAYQPSNTPTQTQVVQAIAAANGALRSAVATTNADIDQANANVTTAYQYAGAAWQAGNCGTPGAPPPPQGHIS
jgi:hypothetical protein